MKLKATYCDGLTAEIRALEVSLTRDGISFPAGELWLYGDLDLLVADKSNGRLLYKNRKIAEPGLTLIFDHGMKDPARDYLKGISRRLTGDSRWHFIRWQVVTGAVIFALMVAFYLIYPYVNHLIVALIPDSWAIRAGDAVLDELYTEYSSNVCHSEAGDKALKKLVKKVQGKDLPYKLRVEVVENSQVNALTAPGGRIVILNGLVQEARSPGELAGILAHEAGHVYYKHPLQGLVNALGFSIAGSFFGGDAATIAVVVLSMSYSRKMERQADKKALATLNDINISARGILGFFDRLNKKKRNTLGVKFQKLLSTHPLSEERMSTITDYITSHESEKNFSSFLTDQEWQSLKNICKSTDKN